MSAVIHEAPPVMAPHRKFTVEEYRRLGETGIFGAEERLELIEGELIAMAPIGYQHANWQSRLNAFFTPRLIGRAIVWNQCPIRLGKHSEPQPDVALLRFRPHGYDQGLPTAADVLLLVEIADSSVRYDREVKIPLYARHGIPEYWIVNISQRQIEAHGDPVPEQGRYRTLRILTEGGLAPACFPDVVLDSGEFLR